MYKFKNFHESGEIVRYVKMTRKTYYCRIPTSDGTNRFCYLDAEDAGGSRRNRTIDAIKDIPITRYKCLEIK